MEYFQYTLSLILTFVGLLMISQMIFFEISKKRADNNNQLLWYMSVDKPFKYTRVKYMMFLCTICYAISSPLAMFTMRWLLYFILFVSIAIVADMIVQYLVNYYAKKRCAKQIHEIKLLQNELIEISQTMDGDTSYTESPKQYDEKTIIQQYLTPQSHVAYLTVDGGEFVKEFNQFTEATFDVEPYGDIEKTKAKLEDLPVQVTSLTSSGQMPFKDNKIDILACIYSNYDKFEIQRILKPQGYFIVNQMGTDNFREILHAYVPYGLKRTWDAYTCCQTLEDIQMRIIDKMEDYATIRFHSIKGMQQFFQKASPDFLDMNKYQAFYLTVLKALKEHGFYELTTHHFCVIAQKV